SGCSTCGRKPSGSRSASRYPQWRKGSKTRSRSELGSSRTSATAVSLAVLVRVAIYLTTRITDEEAYVLDSGLIPAAYAAGASLLGKALINKPFSRIVMTEAASVAW